LGRSFNGVGILFLLFIIFLIPLVVAESYVVDFGFMVSQTVYKVNDTISIKGSLSIANYSDNGTLLANSTGLSGAQVNVSVIDTNTSTVYATYTLNTTSNGEFYSKSDFYSSEVLISAPLNTSYYYLRANYTDPNLTGWWTQTEIQVVNQTVSRLYVSSDKLSYRTAETMEITAEAVTEVGGKITFIPNVTINGTIRNSNKVVSSSFSCVTGANGKCTFTKSAPSSYGEYLLEVNNFKGFSSFNVELYGANIWMKDELGKSIKHTFNTGEQASVEVGVITNSTTETYSFTGTVRSSSGVIVKNISSTDLNINNTFTNRFTTTLDAINFQHGSYYVDVNITKSGSDRVSLSTSFQVQDWDLNVLKRNIASGFDNAYNAFPLTTINLEIYPTWRVNGSLILDLNATTSTNITLVDTMNNVLNITNSTLNTSCGTEGCFEFSLVTPTIPGQYYVEVVVAHSGSEQTVRRLLNVIDVAISAQSTNKEGLLKDLFSPNDYVYLSLSGRNVSSDTNLTKADVVSVIYMNGSEYTYVEVTDFDSVNASNDVLEWAWNSTIQRVKLDTPNNGGVYDVFLSGDNSTAATSARFIVNPYDVCMTSKNTAGQAGTGTDYYYVHHFKTGDTIYLEMKLYQAINPTGRAITHNGTNATFGMREACADQSSTRQVVNNATVTISSVINTLTGKKFSLNVTESGCQADDDKGTYTCTIKPVGDWDSGSYGVALDVLGSDGQSDLIYGGFDAKSFYLHAWADKWRNKPDSAISLTIDMYEAGDNWWSNYGGGGLSGTVSLEKIEYLGQEGEWLNPPIGYGYNVTRVNSSTITNGRGTMELSSNYTDTELWRTGSYRAILKGTDNGGSEDYGYAWFQVKNWEVYASPVFCEGTNCYSKYNLNSKSNISLYVTINNAGEWGQSGKSLGENVTIKVKSINDCRKRPCTQFNSSLYNSTTVIVNGSNGWYWQGSIDPDYLLNITPVSGSWGTGYWQVVLDVNGTETGNGWFNTIAFYVETKPTDVSGVNWKSNIKNNEPLYLSVTTVKSQISGNYYSSYGVSDYLNSTIESAVLRRWDESTYKQVEYNYPGDFNITVTGGGTQINGSRILNITNNNGSWPSGYYWGDLTVKNDDNETSNGRINFQARPFRVQFSNNPYTIDSTACINGTINIYEPTWSSSTLLNGSYNFTSVTERTYGSTGTSLNTYSNFTPNSTFNGSSTFTACPNNGKWGSGSWGNYHYLTVKITDEDGNSENGWLSFKSVPFSVSWGSVFGGTSVFKTNSFVVPATITKASSGANTTGNLSKIYQWRYDNYQNTLEEYVFSVGACFSNVSGNCQVNGTQNVTLYPPSGNWKDGYNYLRAEWIESEDASSIVKDFSGTWFNGVDVYNGYFNSADEDGNWKYDFSYYGNLTTRVYVRDSNSNAATVNITKVEYSTPSTGCWNDGCRTFNNATFSIVGQANTQITDNAIIRIVKPAANWSTGYRSIRVTVSGALGSVVIKGGGLYTKDTTGPIVNVTSPTTGSLVNTSSMWINWTTSEVANCNIYVVSFNNFDSWYCGSSLFNISNQSYCNSTVFTGTDSMYDYISPNYYSSNRGKTWGWGSGSTGLVTGGLTHYYSFSTANLTPQDYGIRIHCSDTDWNNGWGWAALTINYTVESNPNLTNVNLSSPTNVSSINLSFVTFNYTFAGPSYANCSLYGNVSGSWAVNETTNNVSVGSSYFNSSWINGNYLWNVYCVESRNATNFDWANSNWSFRNNYSS
jgi:hypothetical protein